MQHCFRAAVDHVSGDRCVERFLLEHTLPGDYDIVAIGKAAEAMLRAAAVGLGSKMRRGLLICAPAYLSGQPPPLGTRFCVSSHPIPTSDSLAAGQALVEFVQDSAAADKVLFLISGGASAMVEQLIPSCQLEDLQRLNQAALASNLSINAINSLRKCLSQLKAGGLLNFVRATEVTALYLSDVRGDDISVIGSGLLSANERLDAREIAKTSAILPAPLREKIVSSPRLVMQASAQPAAQQHVLANNRSAMRAVMRAGVTQGWPLFLGHDYFTGDAEQLGAQMAQTVKQGLPGLYVWGGESTVSLPARPGRGGRNFHLALAFANALGDANIDCENIAILAGATDGQDGNSGVAGVLLDGTARQRAQALGLSISDAMARADTLSLVEQIGQTIALPATNTNVNDIVLAFKSDI
jgi:hydroxypyruvate reductase